MYSKPHETAPIILGLRAALYIPKRRRRRAEGLEGNEKENGVSHSSPVDQRIISAVSSSSGVGAPGPKTILLLSKADRMPILDRKLDRVDLYRHCTSST